VALDARGRSGGGRICFLAIGGDQADDRSTGPEAGTDHTNWLNDGKTISTTDTGVNTAYLRNLVVIKNSQNPGTGLFPASTNPGSYSYKAWVRDSSFDAMALDADGHYAEAEQYW
jgi:GH15 family glucan-1,4-alpha-glucosidase